MPEKRRPSRLLTLPEAAKVLGVTYERVRVFVTEGRLPAIEVPGIGRVVRRKDLERFQRAPRPTGRPPARQRGPRRARLVPTSIPELLASVEKRTGSLLTLSVYRSLIKTGLLPRRRDFPRGEWGKQLCLAHQYRRLVAIARFQKHSVTTYRDLVIALKLSRYRIAFHTLTRAMVSYLYWYRGARESLTDEDLEQFIMNESSDERPPRLHQRMERRQREIAYRALLNVGFGRASTAQETATVVAAVGLPGELLPHRGEDSGLSWSDILKGVQTIDTEIDRLVDRAVIGPQQKGQRQVILCRPLTSPEELDRAWDVARPLVFHLMPALLRRLQGISKRAHVFYVNATIVKLVATCLILLREYGDAAFSPFHGDLASFNPLWQEAWIRLLVMPSSELFEPVMSLVHQMLVSPPKTNYEYKQVIEKIGEIARSSALSEGNRRVVDSMVTTLSNPSKKRLKRMLSTLDAWRGEVDRPLSREARVE